MCTVAVYLLLKLAESEDDRREIFHIVHHTKKLGNLIFMKKKTIIMKQQEKEEIWKSFKDSSDPNTNFSIKKTFWLYVLHKTFYSTLEKGMIMCCKKLFQKKGNKIFFFIYPHFPFLGNTRRWFDRFEVKFF